MWEASGERRAGAPDARAPERSLAIEVAYEDLPGDTTRAQATADALGRDMYTKYLADDFDEALALAEMMIALDPDNELAREIRDTSRARLDERARAKALPPETVLRASRVLGDFKALPLRPDSVFVLSLVDGATDAETIVDLSGLARPRVLEILIELLELGLVDRKS